MTRYIVLFNHVIPRKNGWDDLGNMESNIIVSVHPDSVKEPNSTL